MKRTIRYIAVCLLLLASVVACFGCDQTNGDPLETLETIDPSWTTAPVTAREEIADPQEFSKLSFVLAEELSAHEEVLSWFLSNSEREQVTHAILCSQDPDNGTWYCWFYADGGMEAATLKVSKDARAEETYLLRYQPSASASANEELPTAGVWYFTLDAEAPQFEVLTDGENVGVLLTYADGSVKR